MRRQLATPPLPIPESRISIRDRRLVAAEADVADMTMRRALRGLRVQPSSLRRIRAALAARGLLAALPPPQQQQS